MTGCGNRGLRWKQSCITKIMSTACFPHAVRKGPTPALGLDLAARSRRLFLCFRRRFDMGRFEELVENFGKGGMRMHVEFEVLHGLARGNGV